MVGFKISQPAFTLLLHQAGHSSFLSTLAAKVERAVFPFLDHPSLTPFPGSVPVSTWNFRASVIQGTQQIYVTVLWYWGAELTKLTVSGIKTTNLVAYGPGMTAITLPIAFILWAIGAVLFLGLPDYYRQHPGQIPSFYRSLTRRKIVMVCTLFFAFGFPTVG